MFGDTDAIGTGHFPKKDSALAVCCQMPVCLACGA